MFDWDSKRIDDILEGLRKPMWVIPKEMLEEENEESTKLKEQL